MNDPANDKALTVHHLGRSQSERIVWLCEELEVPYRLVRYERDAATRLSPPALKAMHPLGAAPLIQDGPLLLAESAAIVEYVIEKHGGGRLRLGPEHPEYAHYLYWFHFANGNLQPAIFRLMLAGRAELVAGHPLRVSLEARVRQLLSLIDARLETRAYLAGELTAADIMSVFSLTTMRLFQPIDLGPYPNIKRYLKRIGERPAYQRAMQRADPELAPLLD